MAAKYDAKGNAICENGAIIYEVGKNYLVRTVTMINVGTLIGVGDHELVLENAAWIPDTGRFESALKECDFREVEMFPHGRPVPVGRAAIIDVVPIDSLPTEGK